MKCPGLHFAGEFQERVGNRSDGARDHDVGEDGVLIAIRAERVDMGLARSGENPESGGVGVVEGEIRTFTDLRSRLRTTQSPPKSEPS